ncbi:MAG: HEAT repeat domain-containing protein [bacterium]|nr:HEAT repeat domain-containing protein [bacterium]
MRKKSIKTGGLPVFLSTFLILGFLLPENGIARPSFEDLKYGSREKQIAAMLDLGYSGNKKVFWYLVRNLERTFDKNDENPWGERYRRAAALSLGRIKDDRALPFLLKQYKVEKKETVKASILFSLRFYKHRTKDILPAIEDGLASSKTMIRVDALQTAAILEDKSVLTKVKEISNSTKNERVKTAAAFCLMNLGDEVDKNLDAIKEGLRSKDPVTRFRSAFYFSISDKIEVIDELQEAIDIENYYWVKKEMKMALSILVDIRRKKKEAEDPYSYFRGP